MPRRFVGSPFAMRGPIVLLIILTAFASTPARGDSPANQVERLPSPTLESPTLLPGVPAARDAGVILPVQALSPVADDAVGPGPVTSEQFEQLLRRLSDVEQQLKKKDEAEKKKAADEKKKAEGWTDVSQEKWTVKLGGHVQADYVNWADHTPTIPGAQNYFAFRRLRLTADGTGYGTYDFRLQLTLEPEQIGPTSDITAPMVKDAYFSMNEIPLLGRFRIGNFFVPFSLEQVTNDTNNIFLERSIPTQPIYAADRELGIAFYNCSDDQAWTWTTGVFVDSLSEGTKLRIDDNQGCRVSGRVTYVPFYDEPSNGRYLLHTGAGILYTLDQDHRVLLRSRPQVNLGPRIIDSGIVNADSYTTGNLELALVWSSFTIQSETFLNTIAMNNGDNVTTSGAYVHVSYFLTGETRIYERFGQHGAQFGRNVPFTNFFVTPGGVGSGAWEVKARWSHLDFNQLDRGQYNDLTVGFNWYWTDRTRVMFDWIHPWTSSQAIFGATSSDLLAMRFDVNW